MNDVKIRNFNYKDVDEFIRISKLSFARELIAKGLTPEDFERETRRIFRMHMIPYRLLTALMGIKWEGFVAEIEGKVVGGGMYIGRNNRMSVTNLMVDPDYRRQGVGKALLARRLERMVERGFPFAMAQVLDSNSASLQNLKGQGFEVFNQYSVYEQTLPFPKIYGPSKPISFRDISPSDRALFKEIEEKTTSRYVLSIKGSADTQFFLSEWQRFYARFTRYSRWIKAVEASGETIGFLCAGFQDRQQKGLLIQPIVKDDYLDLVPAMVYEAGTWLEQAGRRSIIVEISRQWTKISDYLLENGWEKQYTWLEFINWLNIQARRETLERYTLQ